jgi:hypothetical protein
MGTAKADSFGLFPHTCGRLDPADRLHTIARSPRARNPPKGPAILHSLQGGGTARPAAFPMVHDSRPRPARIRGRPSRLWATKGNAARCPRTHQWPSRSRDGHWCVLMKLFSLRRDPRPPVGRPRSGPGFVPGRARGARALDCAVTGFQGLLHHTCRSSRKKPFSMIRACSRFTNSYPPKR